MAFSKWEKSCWFQLNLIQRSLVWFNSDREKRCVCLTNGCVLSSGFNCISWSSDGRPLCLKSCRPLIAVWMLSIGSTCCLDHRQKVRESPKFSRCVFRVFSLHNASIFLLSSGCLLAIRWWMLQCFTKFSLSVCGKMIFDAETMMLARKFSREKKRWWY